MKEERIIILFESDVLKARRMGRKLASEIGFDEAGRGEIEIAISELATNLIKHRAIYGEIILKVLSDGRRIGLEIRSEDQGPGIEDLHLAQINGFSTGGTLGIGLSGVKRLMDEFSIESEIGKGAFVSAKKWLKKDFWPRMKFSVLGRPYPGEDVSGDAHFVKQEPLFVLFGVIDALGHGREAYETSLLTLEILKDNYRESLLGIVERCHHGLRHTRGVAMALCRVDFSRMRFDHIGIGNVETRIYGTPEPIRPFCYNGTLGMRVETYRVTDYPFTEGSTFVMFSDGISEHFNLSSLEIEKSPPEIAKFIFDHYARKTDDAIVLVGR